MADHLGSSNVTYNTSTSTATTQRYYPWGTIRPGPSNALPTDYTFTGQKLDSATGLMVYGARWYDPALGRFVQADTIVPNQYNPQDLNRFSYVRNNPVRYTDPTGHRHQVPAKPFVPAGQPWPDVAPAPASVPGPDPVPVSPAAPVAGDPTAPFEAGVEWLTGEGPRNHEFREGDPFMELLQTHWHVANVRKRIAGRLAAGAFHKGEGDYSLAGLKGVVFYIWDYTNIATGGHTGNLGATFLGSYDLDFWIVSVNAESGTAEVRFHVWNESNLASATHPPVLGYTRWWKDNVESVLNMHTSGPASPTTQNFWWTETIQYEN